LQEIPATDFVLRDVRADLDDADDGFVAGNGRFVTGNIVRHFQQRVLIHARFHLGFADVTGELLEQFQVGETQADNFDAPENLVGTGLEHLFVFIEGQLIGADQLDGPLPGGDGGGSHRGCNCGGTISGDTFFVTPRLAGSEKELALLRIIRILAPLVDSGSRSELVDCQPRPVRR